MPTRKSFIEFSRANGFARSFASVDRGLTTSRHTNTNNPSQREWDSQQRAFEIGQPQKPPYNCSNQNYQSAKGEKLPSAISCLGLMKQASPLDVE
jgi:hypothetical protein